MLPIFLLEGRIRALPCRNRRPEQSAPASIDSLNYFPIRCPLNSFKIFAFATRGVDRAPI